MMSFPLERSNDIFFVGEGITEAYKSKSSVHGMEQNH